MSGKRETSPAVMAARKAVDEQKKKGKPKRSIVVHLIEWRLELDNEHEDMEPSLEDVMEQMRGRGAANLIDSTVVSGIL